jgi:putative sigma-54 modulation protein
MRLQVKGKNLEVSDAIRTYAEQKLRKLGKQLGEAVQVELELSAERNPSIRDNQVAEATVFTKGHSLRVRETSSDMRKSIDGLAEKLLRQVKGYQEKRRREPRRRTEHNEVA